MFSPGLEDPANARLSWELTGARDPRGRGVLFIRSPEPKEYVETGLLGELSRRGHTAPLVVSILALMAAGFWMVIPRFGVIKKDGNGAAGSIRERFLAEARFLKKYRALGVYLNWYIRGIRMKLRQREGGFDDGELIPRIRKICGGDLPLEELLRSREKIGYTDFVKYLRIIKTISERL
jgi:hypothetical protein